MHALKLRVHVQGELALIVTEGGLVQNSSPAKVFLEELLEELSGCRFVGMIVAPLLGEDSVRRWSSRRLTIKSPKASRDHHLQRPGSNALIDPVVRGVNGKDHCNSGVGGAKIAMSNAEDTHQGEG